MAITWPEAKFLCDARRRGVVFDRMATIGRQNCGVSPSALLQLFGKYGITPPAGKLDVTTDLPYAEPILECLGARQIDSIDNSEYESATRIWDLNQPIPEDWY